MTVISILLLLLIPSLMSDYKEITLLDFRNQDEIPEWLIINDRVMGGVSTSDLSFNPDGNLIFTGNVSLLNNGGFASFRSQSKVFDLSGYDGIKLRLRGDGKIYSFRLRTTNSFDGVAWAADFKSLNNEWQEIKIPFKDFTPRYRGRIIINSDGIDIASIRQLGFLISDKQEGAFAIEIDWIKAYSD